MAPNRTTLDKLLPGDVFTVVGEPFTLLVAEERCVLRTDTDLPTDATIRVRSCGTERVGTYKGNIRDKVDLVTSVSDLKPLLEEA